MYSVGIPTEPPTQFRKAEHKMIGTWIGALLILALAFAARKGELFWCNARGIILGTLLQTPGFSLDRMPDLHGKVAVVTGANTGVGLEVAKQLLIANATIVLACRNSTRCLQAHDYLVRESNQPSQIIDMLLDLNDLESIDQFVIDLKAALLQRSPRGVPMLDILINNAGAATQFPFQLTSDGVERTFQANYLGHFALTSKLLPLLKQAALDGSTRARVVHLTSGAHRGAPVAGVPLSVAGVNDQTLGAYARYGVAKLANLAFASELARRHGETVISHAVHPGVVASEMLRKDNFEAMLGTLSGGVAWRLARARNALFAYSTQQAALTVLYPAVAPELEHGTPSNGQLFVPVATPWEPRHPMATDAEFGARLWAFTEDLSTCIDRHRALASSSTGDDSRALRLDACVVGGVNLSS